MATSHALELDTEASGYTRSDGVHFGGFPGVWAPGQPVEISELGFDSEDEALARVDELGLPLRQVNVEPGSAPMPARPNHLFSEDQQRVLDLEQAANWPPTTHAQADQAAATAGIAEWPRPNMKVADKVAFLEQARAGAVTTEGADLAPAADEETV